MRKIKYVLTCVLAISLSAVLSITSSAQEKKADTQGQPQVKRQVLTKQVVGVVAGISSNFIAVDYEKDEGSIREIALTMDKNTRFSPRALKEIKIGDTVAVTYEEIGETKAGQKKVTVIKRLAKTVEFRQAASVNP